MTQHNLTQILKVIRDLVMRNRPCYRDYIGTETTTTSTQIGSGVFEDKSGSGVIANFSVTDSAFTGFVLGETYTVDIGGVTEDFVARNLSPISEQCGPVIGTTTSLSGSSFDGWLAWSIPADGSVACMAQTLDTSFAGKTISISQTKTETVTRYKTKLLPEYLLPTFLRKNVVATKTEVQKAQTTADDAQTVANHADNVAQVALNAADNAQTKASTALTRANNAQATANNAQAAANTAKSTADEAKTKAANAYTKASIAETTAQNAVSFTTTQSLTDTEKKRARDNIGAGTSSFSGVQPDWNQNDSTQPDYVKNRPFYTGNTVETVLVEESTVSFAPADGVYMGILESTFSATVGETYKVSWDGTVYECTCVNFNDFLVIGNISIIGAGSDTGEPFLVFVINGHGIRINTADTSASHTLSISGEQTPIVKIPAKFIDKDASGYIVVHNSSTMTEEEVQNYRSAISKGEAVFIIWGSLCIENISLNSGTGSDGASFFDLVLRTKNNEVYKIAKNNEDLFDLSDREFQSAQIPGNKRSGDASTIIYAYKNRIRIIPGLNGSGVGSADVLFQVDSNGAKSKNFNVLGNGEVVTPAIILYSSTAGSTKKFRITVDDTGALKATEVT